MFNFPIEINDLKDVPEAYQGLYQADEAGTGFTLEADLAARLTAEGDPQIIQTLTSANEGLQSDLEQLRGESDRLMIEKAAMETISKGGGNLNLLMPHMKAALHIEEIEGRREVRINETVPGFESLQKDGASLGADAALDHFRGNPDFAAAFEDKSASGSGMRPAASGAASFNLRSTDQSTINSKIEEIAAGKITVTL